MNSSFDPVVYMETPRWQASRLGLERTVDLLERLGRPQDSLKFVHVAGTNGKGSVCSYIASILQCAGYKVGLFTSPYIETFEERIRVNGKNISREDLTKATLAVREHAQAIEKETGDHPTEFELMTAVALEHFRTVACDIVVLEVGLGGRLDSTNVIDAPEVSVIARIGLDHTSLLGTTTAEVAAEKAGIIKRGCPVVSWPQDNDAMNVICTRAQELECEVYIPNFEQLIIDSLHYNFQAGDLPVRSFTYKGCHYQTSLLGNYQPYNAALALDAIAILQERGWHIAQDALEAGVVQTKWPGRFEVVASDPLVIVDGGHNPQGAEALAHSLDDLFGSKEAAAQHATFVMGVLADKDYEHMIAEVLPYAHAFYTYTPNSSRALDASELAHTIRELASQHHFNDASNVDQSEAANDCAASCSVIASCGNPQEAVVRALDDMNSSNASRVVVAFGSLYSIADIKSALRVLL